MPCYSSLIKYCLCIEVKPLSYYLVYPCLDKVPVWTVPVWTRFKYWPCQDLTIFSALKKSSFFKSMLLLNFPIQWYLNILNLFNISMMLNKCIIQWFWVDVTTKAQEKAFIEPPWKTFLMRDNNVQFLLIIFLDSRI